MKRMSLLIGALLIAAPLFAQSQAKPTQKFTVEFEAGLVMKAGNVWKLPRHDFYLLKSALTAADVDAIIFGYNVEAIKARITGLDSALPFPVFACKDTQPEGKAFCQRFKAAAISNIVTDFESAGSFTVAPGTYYLVGHAVVGVSQAVWNVRIVVDRNQKLILDNRNAATIQEIKQR